jgi:hypothetical protein
MWGADLVIRSLFCDEANDIERSSLPFKLLISPHGYSKSVNSARVNLTGL